MVDWALHHVCVVCPLRSGSVYLPRAVALSRAGHCFAHASVFRIVYFAHPSLRPLRVVFFLPQRDEIMGKSKKGVGIERASNFFKASSHKTDWLLSAMPTNLHLQLFSVEERVVEDGDMGFGREAGKRKAPPPPTLGLTSPVVPALGADGEPLSPQPPSVPHERRGTGVGGAALSASDAAAGGAASGNGATGADRRVSKLAPAAAAAAETHWVEGDDPLTRQLLEEQQRQQVRVHCMCMVMCMCAYVHVYVHVHGHVHVLV